MSQNTQRRRTFLKGIAGVGAASALAGCLGDLTGGGGDENHANISLAPDGMLGIVFDYIDGETTILEDNMSEAGYEPTIQESWEDAPLFAAGGQDFSTISSLEAAQLANQRDIETVVFGRVHPMYMGWWTRTGSAYDPAEAGSVQAAVDAIVEDEALVGVGAWNGGDIPAEALTHQEVHGYDFSEEGDFNVTTADYIAIPTLIEQGDLDVGSTSPEHGGARFMINDPPELTPVFNGVDYPRANGLGAPMLNSLVTAGEYYDENPDAVEALLVSLQEGFDWFLQDPVGIATGSDQYVEMLGAQNAEEAEFIMRWGVLKEYDFETGMIFEGGLALTDSFIDEDRSFLQSATDIGFLGDGWQDKVRFAAL
jgi:hypothetical protein